MKRVGGLWPEITNWDNLLLSYRKARRGKRHRPDVAEFELSREAKLLELQQQLLNGAYLPGHYRLFTIYERKPRLIAAAPFADRVIHHALMNVVEPVLDRRFIFDSYACRKGKGVHAAVNRYQEFAKRFDYVLHVDISKYFPSIDHQILMRLLHERIKDVDTLNLIQTIIDASPAYHALRPIFPDDDLLTPLERPCGIPIGNLTSQCFANLYLDDIDHWLKEDIRIPGYIRYVDDLYLLSSSRTELDCCLDKLQCKLADYRLKLHPAKIQLRRTTERVDVLGYKISRTRRWLRNDNGYKAVRRFREFQRLYNQGYIDLADITPSIRSWEGHAIHAETLGLRSKLFYDLVFTRA